MASKKEKYSIGNSRSPMIFRKKKDKDRSRSLDDLISSVDHDDGCPAGAEWPELASVKRMAPVVMCLLPAFSADFVCSALLSLGATPLVTDDDSEDVLLHQFSHALALWCVAVEEATSHAHQKKNLLPATMRQALIDALHYLEEPHIRSAAKLSLYCMRTGKTS